MDISLMQGLLVAGIVFVLGLLVRLAAHELGFELPHIDSVGPGRRSSLMDDLVMPGLRWMPTWAGTGLVAAFTTGQFWQPLALVVAFIVLVVVNVNIRYPKHGHRPRARRATF